MPLLIRSWRRWYLGATHDHGGPVAGAGCGLSGSGLDEAAETKRLVVYLALGHALWACMGLGRHGL